MLTSPWRRLVLDGKSKACKFDEYCVCVCMCVCVCLCVCVCVNRLGITISLSIQYSTLHTLLLFPKIDCCHAICRGRRLLCLFHTLLLVFLPVWEKKWTCVFSHVCVGKFECIRNWMCLDAYEFEYFSFKYLRMRGTKFVHYFVLEKEQKLHESIYQSWRWQSLPQ